MVGISDVDMSAALTIGQCWSAMYRREYMLETGAIFGIAKAGFAAQPPAPRGRQQGAISPYRVQLPQPVHKPVGKFCFTDHPKADLRAKGWRRGQHDARRRRDIAVSHRPHQPNLT
jgi:hypothetical protein